MGTLHSDSADTIHRSLLVAYDAYSGRGVFKTLRLVLLPV